MDEVEADGGNTGAATSGDAKRQRKRKIACLDRTLNVDIRTLPPEVISDCSEKRSIQLYIEERRYVWLRVEDVPWAVKYMYIQNMLKGVPFASDDPRGPSGAASSSGGAASSSAGALVMRSAPR